MNPFDFTTPAPEEEQSPRLAQLTRHLSARLGEFFALTITRADQKAGTLTITHQGGNQPQTKLANQLASHFQVLTVEEEGITFHLRVRHQFEDIDRLWGCFFSLLG